ncbi:acyl-CoA N-acyltransferase [Scenedesmus sp. NREL 46B-D3]|nr:acyl-CoA N-acyltransferase [Scenedesmus sp. NREL 46B-D3]
MESKLPPGYTLRMAASHADFRSFAGLAVHYHQWLDVDLCFQDFEHELASLPGSYAQPAGCILLVSHSSCPESASEDVACVAVRPLKGQAPPLPSTPHQHQQHNAAHRLETSPTCELKRLWVEEPHQRFGLGRVLMAAALQAIAGGMGYSSMVLDTLERLTSANRLYEQLGFEKIAAYYDNPLPGGAHTLWRQHNANDSIAPNVCTANAMCEQLVSPVMLRTASKLCHAGKTAA